MKRQWKTDRKETRHLHVNSVGLLRLTGDYLRVFDPDSTMHVDQLQFITGIPLIEINSLILELWYVLWAKMSLDEISAIAFEWREISSKF
jgi:hypothetical protein